jgi:hypothetical protein
MKELTFYNISYGKSNSTFIFITDNSIPLIFLKSYVDIKNSVIFEKFISIDIVPILKKICKDTKKEAILNCNNFDFDIAEISIIIMGHKVTWKNYSFKNWNNFYLGLRNYSEEINVIIEVDHPIDIKDKNILKIINKGNEIKK